MTNEELQDKTEQFNQTLHQYGRQKALHGRLGSTAYEKSLLEALHVMLGEIQTEIERRRNEAKEQAPA